MIRFLAYNKFPEVYHAHGISKAAISAAGRRVTERGRNTTYSVIITGFHRYILCHRAAARRCGSVRSCSANFRISAEK
ncbi:hypothetical protein DCT84_004925 [Salmonella enterica subsp. enterica serovar Glostrup]|nr:hypothetical protein [Salmonella enterica]EBF2453547.1 hypothetical protein [Salmonella enterica subsp. enterica serovar Poona]EDP9440172.1 hypothetical protein [Salmonella enterica subsp. enterica serovar Irumu]EDQ2738852.1 hypothetical protein [Salmonella enterica subsp. enterica]EDQ7108700.1 hypothetical protein [Salmonella enterica subsp. enterica serovar Glostrup]